MKEVYNTGADPGREGSPVGTPSKIGKKYILKIENG
jgi:hypothetical protein